MPMPLGFRHSKESLLRMSRSHFGARHSEKTKRAMSQNRLGEKNPLYGTRHSKETRKKISKALMGRRLADEHKRNISISNMGKRASEETIEKLRLSKRGKNHPNWQGGKSFEDYGLEFDGYLKSQIRKRDNYVCQKCLTPENGWKHSVHHIDYDKKNNDPNNLITLCKGCHIRTNYNRVFWKTILELPKIGTL